MTSYIMYNILKVSVFWKIWRRSGGALTSFRGGGLGWPWSGSDYDRKKFYCKKCEIYFSIWTQCKQFVWQFHSVAEKS